MIYVNVFSIRKRAIVGRALEQDEWNINFVI